MKYYKLFFNLCLLLMLSSCEEEFLPDVANAEPDIVVEGYIEFGENAFPPYVLLTKSLSFFAETNLSTLDDFYVRGAVVTVSDGLTTATLQEFCLADLTPDQVALLSTLLGQSVEDLGANFCVYIDLSGSLDIIEGGTYTLNINAGGKTLKSVTTIPTLVPLDTVFFIVPPGEKPDSLAQLRTNLNDPGDIENFYRYKTKVPGEPFYPGVNSVFDDGFINGKDFEFPLDRGQSPFDNFGDDYGLFTRGDTVQLAWYAIDKAHFEFWESLEFNRQNQGPFSNYTIIKTNIEGGLGIWGGFSSEIISTIVPPN